MITIIYTEDAVENEPGPNFYWRGDPADFLQLVFAFHPLGASNNVEIHPHKLDYVQVKGKYNVIVKSSDNGNTLCDICENTIIIDLKKEIWREILIMFLGVSYYPSHNYVEFEEGLSESANFVISSEGRVL